MKLIAVIDPTVRRQTVEDQVIEFWRRKGVDEDVVDIFDEIKFSLVGDRALSADKLERSLNVLHDRTSISFEKDFDTEGSLFDVFSEYLASENDGRILGTISYSRGFELNCNRTLAKKIGKAGGMRFLELFPCFVCSRSSTQPEKWFFSVGVAGDTLKCWKSNELVEEFGRVLESKIVPSGHWRDGTFEWREMKGGRGPLVYMSASAHYGNKVIQDMLVEIEQNHGCPVVTKTNSIG
jgi:hypothetical protein